jgi:hypothetical protein
VISILRPRKSSELWYFGEKVIILLAADLPVHLQYAKVVMSVPYGLGRPGLLPADAGLMFRQEALRSASIGGTCETCGGGRTLPEVPWFNGHIDNDQSSTGLRPCCGHGYSNLAMATKVRLIVIEI